MWPEASHRIVLTVIQRLGKWIWRNLLRRVLKGHHPRVIRVVRKRSYVIQQVDELSIELPSDDITLGDLWGFHPEREGQDGDFDVKSLRRSD